MDLVLINKAKVYVETILAKVKHYEYHNISHALEVTNRAIYLGQKEGISGEDLEKLALACLFHDTGFIRQYDSNEVLGAKIARLYLNSIGYGKQRVKEVCKMILSTNPELIHPKNILEEIIKDADLDNLGRKDFFEQGKLVKKELETVKNIKISEEDWNSSSLFFIENHKFYTETQRNEREAQRIKNEKKLKKLTGNSKLIIKPNY